ncbi:MAG: isocitrate lyase/phosphoenolpyruvate mutase family protein [Oryzihumus sp.]
MAGVAHAVPTVLTPRTDVFLNHPGWDEDARLTEALTRGDACLEVGADCVLVPGCTRTESIGARVAALEHGPVSLLAVPGLPDTRALQEPGVASLSHGPLPSRATLNALLACPRFTTA